VRNFRIVATTLVLVSSFCLSVAQNQPPIGIRPQPPEGKGVVVLRAARLIDGTGAPAINNGVVVVTDNKITAVGDARSVRVPQGVKVIDLGDATLLPGFIDAHTHLIGRVLGDPEGDTSAVRDYDAWGAILGVIHARDTLMAGFTSVRNVGADGPFSDMALRKAINEGWTPGPRMETAGHAIGITGGHCDENGYKPGLLQLGPMQGVANGPEEVRAAVRYQIKYGADVIKTCATGGVLSEGDAVGATQYSYEELKALVDEASKLDRKVAAHAHGTEGIKIATRAGVSSIEHGSFLDEEGARMMKERGTFLVPTLMAGEAVERAAPPVVLRADHRLANSHHRLAGQLLVPHSVERLGPAAEHDLELVREVFEFGLAPLLQPQLADPRRIAREDDVGVAAADEAAPRFTVRFSASQRLQPGPFDWVHRRAPLAVAA